MVAPPPCDVRVCGIRSRRRLRPARVCAVCRGDHAQARARRRAPSFEPGAHVTALVRIRERRGRVSLAEHARAPAPTRTRASGAPAPAAGEAARDPAYTQGPRRDGT